MPTEKEYLIMISKKTAALIQFSMDVGLICNEAKDSTKKKLSSYAFNTALAFQIKDDLIDICENRKPGEIDIKANITLIALNRNFIDYPSQLKMKRRTPLINL